MIELLAEVRYQLEQVRDRHETRRDELMIVYSEVTVSLSGAAVEQGNMMTDTTQFLAALGNIPTITDGIHLRQKSRDYYWYSPVLKRQLQDVAAAAIIMPRDENDIIAVLKACYRHHVPLTVRGAGTGNYGQAMPIRGGIVLDVSALDRLLWVKPGLCRVEAGMTISRLDEALGVHGQEVRMFSSTYRTATVGGFVAGGSGGVGSITWGMLREPGNVVAARILSMEAEPRVIELRGSDVTKITHSYGCTGVITELEMPLAPAYEWVDVILAFDDFMAACRFAQALTEAPGIVKKLATVIAFPIPQSYFKPLAEVIPDGKHIVIAMIAAHAWEAFVDFARAWAAPIIYRKMAREVEEEHGVPLYEFTWNHTTLWALKSDPGMTYLQTRFPAPDHLAKIETMYSHFGDEVPMHVEFLRDGGTFAAAGLQLVRFTTEQRLNEIMAFHEANGCQQFNPHVYTLEEGGMKRVDPVQLAFKREVDPKGLLNPGKMRGWEDPSWNPNPDQSHARLRPA